MLVQLFFFKIYFHMRLIHPCQMSLVFYWLKFCYYYYYYYSLSLLVLPDSLAGSHNSTGFIDLALVHSSAKNFL
jgi:hypothetical protein